MVGGTATLCRTGRGTCRRGIREGEGVRVISVADEVDSS